MKNSLPVFGDYQDAMVTGQPFLHHAILSVYMNAGLLGWREICEAAEAAWRAGDVPLNAAEGFIRQIIGWREYIRGVYFREGPDYTSRNVLEARRDLAGLVLDRRHRHALPARMRDGDDPPRPTPTTSSA